MLRIAAVLCAALFLTACSGEKIWAPDDKVAAARYVAPRPTTITLFTGINDRNGTGAHSGLLINGSQRVLFDPAGTWTHPAAPERNDVFFGMTDRILAFYRDYHARDSETEKFHQIEQTIEVSPEIAELILQKALANGAVPKAHCAQSISSLLRTVPGFESLPQTYYPKKLAEGFRQLPGVTERIITEENDNPGEGHGVIMVDKKGNRIN